MPHPSPLAIDARMASQCNAPTEEHIMSIHQAVIWIDHLEAHVIHFDAEHSVFEKLMSNTKETHIHHHRGTLGSGKAQISPKFLHDVLESVADVKRFLVVGPGSAKLELIKYAHLHDPEVAEKITGVETVDHPTDPQLLVLARKYFL
jgi:stalled ribosome rescue protein Dom34